MRFLARWYARRIVNVNVNIIAAGLFALPPTMLVVHFSRHWGLDDEHKFGILLLTFVTDIVFDFLIYFILHWIANHGSWRNKFIDKAEHLLVEPAHAGMEYLRDAGVVQFQRFVLSPVLYTLWMGIHYTLMKAGMDRVLAMLIGWVVGVAAARTLHTLWMLREERITREKRLAAMNLCKTCGMSLAGVVADKCPECGQLIVRPAFSQPVPASKPSESPEPTQPSSTRRADRDVEAPAH
jgi:predicted RNA-binding Zn-ribbon protein involved in translation (DUF1610 family)